MNGKINLDIRFGKLQYYFELVRNITIINDDSATGKSTLVKNLSDRDDIGYSSVKISSGGYQVLTLNKDSWKAAQFMPELYKDSIIFIDEMQYFIDTPQFSKFVKDTGSYFVLITRSDIENLSYSVKEIYSLDIKGNKHTLKRKYNIKKNFYNGNGYGINPQYFLTEDRNSGYQFFKNVARKFNATCEYADGKSNIKKFLYKFKTENKYKGKIKMVICDGAAIGSNIKDITLNLDSNTLLFLPESFEYMILNSGVVGKNEKILDRLKHTYNYVNYNKHYNWERYYTEYLCEITENYNEYRYSKSNLKKKYLEEGVTNQILENNYLCFKRSDSTNKMTII